MLRGIFGSGGGAPVGGTGTTNTIPRWTGPSTLGDSGLIDNGTAIYTTTRNFGIGTASPTGRLHVVGGTAAASTNGAPVTIIAQSGGTGNTNGGSIVLTPGTQAGSGTVGLVDLSGPTGTGLKLPATPGNADTQTLDCYSEGTLNTGFTLNGVTASAGNVNYEARWVRIGRAVSLRLRIFPDAGAQITFAAGANVVMTGTPAATSPTAMATAANDGPSGRASALWDANTVYLNTALTFGANVNIYFNGTAV